MGIITKKKEVLFGNNILNSKDYSHYASIDYKTDITKKNNFSNRGKFR